MFSLTSFNNELNLDNIHLSISGLSSYLTLNSLGSISSVLAYIEKKLYTFLILLKNFDSTSFNPSSSNLVGVHGGDTWIKYHLSTSAPYLSNKSNGSTVFPLDLDIFLPSLSRTRSLTRTFLYGDFPVTNVDIAISE